MSKTRRRLMFANTKKQATEEEQEDDSILLFGIYESSSNKMKKYAQEWYENQAIYQSGYSDGSYHIPNHSEWNNIAKYYKSELLAFLNSVGITTDDCFACSSWNTVRDMPYYRIYVSEDNLAEDHTGNKSNCYCILIKWNT